MKKKQLSHILARCTDACVTKLADKVREQHEITLLKEPRKTLCMLKLREPVKNSLFYLGEAIVCEAIVELDGHKGMAVLMGDDFDKVLNMAVIDAAFNAHCEECTTLKKELLILEVEQKKQVEEENARYLKSMVRFESLDH